MAMYGGILCLSKAVHSTGISCYFRVSSLFSWIFDRSSDFTGLSHFTPPFTGISLGVLPWDCAPLAEVGKSLASCICGVRSLGSRQRQSTNAPALMRRVSNGFYERLALDSGPGRWSAAVRRPRQDLGPH